jgi:ABC-type multidrug transport system ATPase subunit
VYLYTSAVLFKSIQEGDVESTGHAKCVDLQNMPPPPPLLSLSLSHTQNLYYSARLRLPKKYHKIQRRNMIEDVMEMLEITRIRDSVVGSVSRRGISGGQRKRVNIGLELVADPTLLFLDEPTSGLDATSSQIVLRALQQLTRLGRTIVAVIHQPRYSIFTMFDQVILLGVGGQTVYSGSAKKARQYFSSIGFDCPDGENCADFFMDVIAGEVDRQQCVQDSSSSIRPNRAGGGAAGGESRAGGREVYPRSLVGGRIAETKGEGKDEDEDEDSGLSSPPHPAALRTPTAGGFVPSDLFSLWRNSETESWAPEYDGARGSVVIIPAGEAASDGTPATSLSTPIACRTKVGWCSQYHTNMAQYSAEYVKDWRAIVKSMSIIVGSALVGGMYSQTSQWGADSFAGMTTKCTMLLALLGVAVGLSSIPTFGGNRPMMLRELSSGTSASAYYLARITVDLIILFLVAWVSTSILVNTGGFPKRNMFMVLFIIFGICFVCSGMAYFVTLVFDLGSAVIITSLVIVIFGAILNGTQVRRMGGGSGVGAMGAYSHPRPRNCIL